MYRLQWSWAEDVSLLERYQPSYFVLAGYIIIFHYTYMYIV